MDQQRFDAIARAAADGSSRRGVLKGLGAAFVGGAVGLFGIRGGRVAAQCTEYGYVCYASTECCTGHCEIYENGHGRCLTPPEPAGPTEPCTSSVSKRSGSILCPLRSATC